MITAKTFEAIRKHGPGTGTAVCLGAQVTSKATGFNNSKSLFQSLGYGEFWDVDYDGKAARIWDLNNPIPSEWHGQASILFDGGVLEHVANIGQGLVGVHNLVKEGGVVVMINPLNCYGESYYGLDPQLYRDFFTSNSWDVLQHELHEYRGVRASLLGAANRIIPDRLKSLIIARIKRNASVRDWCLRDNPSEVRVSPVEYGRHRRLSYTVHQMFVARKGRASERIIWPSQSMYPKSATSA